MTGRLCDCETMVYPVKSCIAGAASPLFHRVNTMVNCSLACLSEGCGSVICGYWVIEYIDFNLQLIGGALRLLGIPEGFKFE